MGADPTLVDLVANPALAATPALAAEVELDRVPETPGEIERLPGMRWARLTIRNNPPDRTEDRFLVPARPA